MIDAYLLERQFRTRQTELIQLCDPEDQERLLRYWARASDTHMSRQFLDMNLGQILNIPFDQLVNMQGVGLKRIERLLTILQRVAVDEPSVPSTELAVVKHEQVAKAVVPTGEPVTFDNLTEMEWEKWCDLIRNHRLTDEPLGRFVPSLQDLSQQSWNISLGEYTSYSLEELRARLGTNTVKIRKVLKVFSEITKQTHLFNCDLKLSIRLYPPIVRDIIAWAESLLDEKRIPNVEETLRSFVNPLLIMLENDIGQYHTEITRRRIGVNTPRHTLEEIAIDYGITRERVRQLTLKPSKALKARWPEGAYLLDNLYSLFQSAENAAEPLRLIQVVLEIGFDMKVAKDGSRDSVLSAWQKASRAKRTPMTENEVRSWAAEIFPNLAPTIVQNWLIEEKLQETFSDNQKWFRGTEPLDNLLTHLGIADSPTTVAQVPEFIGGDERSAKMRMERDPRLIVDDQKRIRRAEDCSFFRQNGRWFLCIDSLPNVDLKSESIAIEDLIHMIIGAAIQIDVGDATTWGVHRLANSLLLQSFGGTFAPCITPFVLEDALVTHSNGLICPMRRRRLQWGTANHSIPVRGKFGWIDHLVSTIGTLLTREELEAAMHDHYQDYGDYVMQQLQYVDNTEDGVGRLNCQIIPGIALVAPTIFKPSGWVLNAEASNISEGIRIAAEQFAAMSLKRSQPITRRDQFSWIVELCQHSAFGFKIEWQNEDTAPDDKLIF